MGRRSQLLLSLALVTAACGTAGEAADDVNDGPNRTFGIPACRTSRIWAVTIGDITATFVGAVRNDAEFDTLIPIVGDFLMSNVMFGDADG